MPEINKNDNSPSEIGRLNDLLSNHFKNNIQNVKIRFDEPDPDNLPTEATFHLFLYLVHEDLDIRHSKGRPYDAAKGRFMPENAYVRCHYLATYWRPNIAPGYDSPAAAPDSEAVLNLSKMLRALLRLRNEETFRNYQLRIIEPEALNSLGNFWQALNNKPRTIINFAITLPISLADVEDKVPAVLNIKTTLMPEQKGANWLLPLEQQLFAELQQVISPGGLARVTLQVNPMMSDELNPALQPLSVSLSGYAFTDVADKIIAVAESWKGEKQLENTWVIMENNFTGLQKAPAPKSDVRY